MLSLDNDTTGNDMSLKDVCLKLVGKYGPHARIVSAGVLNVVAPGSGALIDITSTVIEAAQDIADNKAHAQWEQQLIEKVDQSQAEIEKVGQLLEFLSGPLAAVCDKASAFADDPEEMEEIIGKAIAKDPSLAQTLHAIQTLKSQFEVFHDDIRKIAANQREAMPVYERMNRVADFFDELWDAGVKPREFAEQIANHRQIAIQIGKGATDKIDERLESLHDAAPAAASVHVLEAAAATRDFDYPGAQKALTRAVKLRPKDRELVRLKNQITVMATQATPSDTKPATNGDRAKRLKSGQILDGWKLAACRGAGGWGQVFRASKNGDTKAIKIMHPEFAADKTFVERFKKEIASLWNLPQHPNLLKIDKSEKSFGFCTDHQTWYLAMEYIDGPTLENYLSSNGALSEAQIRQVFPDLVEGLAAAHDANIVHRDIKPGNMIFRSSDQKLVLVDFGLAVGVQDFGETSVGGISIQFAAPEQHYGGSATKSSDVFSMCAVMHYALNYADAKRRVPHAFDPGMAPDSLRDILSSGLVMAPEKRCQDATQLAQPFKAIKKKPAARTKSVPMTRILPADELSKKSNASKADSPTVSKPRGTTPVRKPVAPVKQQSIKQTIQKPPAASKQAEAKDDSVRNASNPATPRKTSAPSATVVKTGPATSNSKPVRRKPRVLRMLMIGVLVLAALGAAVGAAGYFVSNLLEAAREQAMHERSQNKLGEIGYLLHRYYDRYNAFPPSSSHPDVGIGHSWRAYILEYYSGEEGANTELDYDFSKPAHEQDDDIRYMTIDLFISPFAEISSGSGYTSYLAIADDEGFFRPWPDGEEASQYGPAGRTKEEIEDGLANTIAVIEYIRKNRYWTHTHEFDIDGAIDHIQWSDRPVNVLMGDGSAGQVDSSMSESELRALMTINGGEKVDLKSLNLQKPTFSIQRHD